MEQFHQLNETFFIDLFGYLFLDSYLHLEKEIFLYTKKEYIFQN